MNEFEIHEREMLEKLAGAVAELPASHVASVEREDSIGRPGYIADGVMDVVLRGEDIQLVIKAKRDLFPRDVREIVWQLRRYIDAMPGGRARVPVLVGRAISEGAREILRDENVGYYDLSGSLFIPTRNAYVLIDRPAAKKAAKALGSIFHGQRARVVQAILEASAEWVTVKELAEQSGASAATTSETLTEMERRDWIDIEGSGPSKRRCLRDRAAVLDEWARLIVDQKAPRLERYYVPAADVHAISHRLAEASQRTGTAYAVTGEVAAQAYAPYLSSISQLRCRIEAGSSRADMLDFLGARPVSEGWNLAVLETNPRGELVIGEVIDGVAYAPVLRVYLDLLQGSGRSKDMAAHLRTERLS